MACLARARPASEYEALLADHGLAVVVSEPHNAALAEMIEMIDARLRALSMLGAASELFDFPTILSYIGTAARAVSDGVAGYHLIVARKPPCER